MSGIPISDLEEKTQKPIAQLFDVIAGTSSGGMIALGLNVPREGLSQGELVNKRMRLSRLIRDVERKAKAILSEISRQAAQTLRKAKRIYEQKRGDKGYLYSWHAPEVECISKRKARKPYEFGCKVSLATQLKPTRGPHFILQAQAVHKNPYDGHTLAKKRCYFI